MHVRIARIILPVGLFRFWDKTADGKGGEPKDPPNADPNPPKSEGDEPQPSIEDQIEAMREKNPKLYNVVFGRGVKKGSSEGLQKEELDAARKLFAHIDPSDVDSLLKAKQDAEAAKIENARKTEDFKTFAKELEEKAKKDKENVEKSYKTQLDGLRNLNTKNETVIGSLRDKLTKVLIVKELQSVAASKGIIDPTDAVVHLERKIVLDDNFEPIVDEKYKDQGSTISDLVDNLIKAKPHLVKASQAPGNGEQAPKTGAQAQGDPNKRKFKRSELRDPKFFKEHENEIMAAAREGLIVDDISTRIQ